MLGSFIRSLRQKIEELIFHMEDFTQLFFQLMNSVDKEQQRRIAMMLWSVWRRRNDRQRTNQIVVQHGDMFFQDWLKIIKHFV